MKKLLVFLCLGFAMTSGASSAQTCHVSLTQDNGWTISTSLSEQGLDVFLQQPGATPSQDLNSRVLLGAEDFSLKFSGQEGTVRFKYIEPATFELRRGQLKISQARPLGPFQLQACFNRCARSFPGNDGVCRAVCQQTNDGWAEYQAAYFAADVEFSRKDAPSVQGEGMVLKRCF